MDTLVQRHSPSLMNKLIYNHHSVTTFSGQNNINLYNQTQDFSQNPLIDDSTDSVLSSGITEISKEESPEKDMPLERDFFDGVLKYIDQMLMEEEDVQNKPCMFHECSALQAAEKSFYDVLGEKYPPPRDYPLDDSYFGTSSSQSSNSSNLVEFESYLDQSYRSFQPNFQSIDKPVDSPATHFPVSSSSGNSQFTRSILNPYLTPTEEGSSKGKKIMYEEDCDYQNEEPGSKKLATYTEEQPSAIYDKVLLCSDLNPDLLDFTVSLGNDFSAEYTKSSQKKNGRTKRLSTGKPRGKKQDNKIEFVDLRSLLTQCAQSIAGGDVRTAEDILKRIRQHSSPQGDGTQRLAHYFANAIEARLVGTGVELYSAFTKRRISAADIIKAYQAYVTASPFQRMSNIVANKSIVKLARGAKRLHIIDFGILYGFQWPCFIQKLSLRPGGPPKLRITGIDLPQPGFRPTERVEETGRRLRNYCERFGVPFEYNAIAKKWDTINLEDLKIDKEEMLVVNCMYRLRNVPDETVVENSPRDAVLDMIKTINPDMFVHGVLNGTYNAPFFITRFKEALYHFSSLFDMFEATAPREDKNRMLFEQEVFARDAMNVIACEGTARIERPETYKQWHYRNLKAGFRQLPLHQDLMKEIRAKVKLQYHKDFVVDEESNWMLQGWKGRLLYALSLWKPVQEK